MARQDVAGPVANEVLLASGARTATGNTANLTGFASPKTLRVQLEVTAASGTTPTLDVVLQDTLDGAGYNTIGTFTQKVAAAREVINVTAPFSDTLRVLYTIAGTTPSFTFSVICFSE